MNITAKVTSEELEEMNLSADSLEDAVYERLDYLNFTEFVGYTVVIDEIE